MNKIPQPKIALVAGASGIVGRELVKTLLRNRWEVIGLSRQASPHLENIPFIHVDLLDAQHSAQNCIRSTASPTFLQRMGQRRELGGNG